MNSVAFSLDPSSKVKLYRQLSDAIIASIRDGTLEPRSKLPSIRILSDQLGISKNTITKAYSELEQGGYIYSENKKGYFVGNGALGGDALPAEEQEAAVPTVDFILRQRKPEDAEFSLPSPAIEKSLIVETLSPQASPEPARPGVPAKKPVPPHGSPGQELLESYRAVLSDRAGTFSQAKEPFGQLALRRAIAAFLDRVLGIRAEAEQIVVAAEAGRLLSDLLALKSLSMPYVKSDGMGLLQLATKFTEGSISTVQPVAAVAETTGEALRKKFTAAGIPVREIPIDDQGMSFDFLVTSGTTMAFVTPDDVPVGSFEENDARVQEIIGWAEGVSYRHIIEYDSAPGPDSPHSYKSADTPDKVIYIQSFKNLIGNGMEAAFAVLPKDICADFQQHYDHFPCSLPLLDQLALADFIGRGCLESAQNQTEGSDAAED